MPERSKSENRETEKSPETNVSNAVSAIENKDAQDGVISSGWAQNAKGYLGKSLGVLLVGTAWVTLKLIEKSALFLKGAVENPDNPTKWFGPLVDSFKKGKDKK